MRPTDWHDVVILLSPRRWQRLSELREKANRALVLAKQERANEPTLADKPSKKAVANFVGECIEHLWNNDAVKARIDGRTVAFRLTPKGEQLRQSFLKMQSRSGHRLPTPAPLPSIAEE